jgi:hypothetical protein
MGLDQCLRPHRSRYLSSFIARFVVPSEGFAAFAAASR